MFIRILATMLLTTLLVAACGGAPPEPPTSNQQPNTTSAPPQTLAAAPASPMPTTATQVPLESATVASTAAPSAKPATAVVVPPTTVPVAPTTASQTVPDAVATTGLGSEILFLRGGKLVAYGVATRKERTLAEGVNDFTATPDGRLIALVRGTGLKSELWLLNRDGSGLRQLTRNNRAEATPVFAPDGLTLAFAAAKTDIAPGQDWGTWSRWSSQSEVRLLNIASGAELLLGAGADPAFSPDGRRVAFATAPSRLNSSGSADYPLGEGNAIRLVNRLGQNGWNFATAGDPARPDSGLLVYAPVFSADGAQLAYKRYAGVQVEVDIVYTELGNSLQGKGVRIGTDSGWLAPRFAPDGTLVAVSDNFAEGQRGWGGYEQWSVSVLRPGGSHNVTMPDGQITLAADQVDQLRRAQRVAWSPAADALAVQLPSGWRAGLPLDQPTFTEATAGELWRWTPGAAPSERLINGVDFASPLLWLPAPPTVQSHAASGYHLAHPAGWQLAAPTEFEEISASAPDDAATMSAAPTRDAPVASAFPTLVAEGAKEEPATTWPDGSSYREFSGTSLEGKPVAGAVRVSSSNGITVLTIYLTTPELWPHERAQAQGLLAASGTN